MARPDRPLCIDLDGTLIHTDVFAESLLRAFSHQPVATARAFAKHYNNRAQLKAYAAQCGGFDAATLPYNHAVLDFARAQKKLGRKLILVTASHRNIAEAVNAHLDSLFDDVIASSNSDNIRGTRKAEVLIQSFGDGAFDYMGNDKSDLNVWPHAHTAYAVNCSDGLVSRINGAHAVDKTYQQGLNTNAKIWTKALRSRQWIKNLLIVIAPFAAHDLSAATMLKAALAFIAFSMVSSAGYIINDLFDVEDDRRHSTKKARPFASGALSPQQGMAMAAILPLVALSISLLTLPFGFSLVCLAYLIATVIYTVYFKTTMLLDVYTLGSFFTLRVIAGGVATSTVVSMWLLSFIWLFFTGLAFLKRFTELNAVRGGKLQLSKRRNYTAADANIIEILGIATSLLTIPILASYAASDAARELYHHINYLWAIVPLIMAWQTRMWFLASRGEMDFDPVEFAVKDRVSHLFLITILVILWCAQ